MIRNFEYLIVFTSAPGVVPEQNDPYRIQPWKVNEIKAYKNYSKCLQKTIHNVHWRLFIMFIRNYSPFSLETVYNVYWKLFKMFIEMSTKNYSQCSSNTIHMVTKDNSQYLLKKVFATFIEGYSLCLLKTIYNIRSILFSNVYRKIVKMFTKDY